MKRKRILVCSRDPGGTNAVVQLIGPLRALGYEVAVYGKDAAIPIYRKQGIECTGITEVLPVVTAESAAELSKKVSADMILTGTSSEDFTERCFWQAAERNGIPSFAVLDQWVNYALRFLPQGETAENHVPTNGSLILPSTLFIMDEFAKREMRDLGMEENRLVVTGQPFFDYVRESGDRYSAEDIRNLRRTLMGGKPGVLIVFASQPISKLYRENGLGEDYWGYTEKTILGNIAHCLDVLAESSDSAITLVVRLHPKEDVVSQEGERPGERGGIRWVFDRDTDSNLLLKASDLVIGMFSMVLLEAAILGKNFLSVQIGLKRENPLVFDRMGTVKSILTQAELALSLKRVLSSEAGAPPDLGIQFGATRRIIDYLTEI